MVFLSKKLVNSVYFRRRNVELSRRNVDLSGVDEANEENIQHLTLKKEKKIFRQVRDSNSRV